MAGVEANMLQIDDKITQPHNANATNGDAFMNYVQPNFHQQIENDKSQTVQMIENRFNSNENKMTQQPHQTDGRFMGLEPPHLQPNFNQQFYQTNPQMTNNGFPSSIQPNMVPMGQEFTQPHLAVKVKDDEDIIMEFDSKAQSGIYVHSEEDAAKIFNMNSKEMAKMSQKPVEHERKQVFTQFVEPHPANTTYTDADDGAVTPAEDSSGSETGSDEDDDDDEDGEVTFEFRGNVAWPAFSDSDSF